MSCNNLMNGRGCPYCSGKKVGTFNSLEFNYPQLCSEWDIVKNQSLKPSDVVCNSTKKIWWKCKTNENHSWQARVYQRTSFDTGCPYCSGRRATETENLLELYPQISKEWDYDKNSSSPKDYRPKSHKKVWWKCEKGHEWEAVISSRVNGRGCQKCSESKGEKRIKDFLVNNKVIFETQKMFPSLIGTGGGRLSYDFYVPKYNLLIEYQGKYHDGTAKIQTKEGFINQKEHDSRKRCYAQQNDIRLLEIWYYNFDRIEEILSEFLLKEAV